MRASKTQHKFFILILVYCATPVLINGAASPTLRRSSLAGERMQAGDRNAEHETLYTSPYRQRRQVSIDDLLSTALQIVRPIFDTAQPLPFDSAMIPKQVSAEHSTGARESKILGAPAYSSLRDVPICRGNSQICKFISCTAHNFKNDQNLSNLNLAAQMLNDRDFRKTISQNPETITTVCHEQGLSTEQCRLFSRAFQLIDRFMTSIQKPEPLHNLAGTGDDEEDDGIIGSAKRKKQNGNTLMDGSMPAVSPLANRLVLDDDVGSAGTRPATDPLNGVAIFDDELPRSKFFRGHTTNTVISDIGKVYENNRQVITDEFAGEDEDDITDALTEVTTRNLSSTSSASTSTTLATMYQASPAPKIASHPFVGSRTWSTHIKNNNNFNKLYHAVDGAVSRQFGRDPLSTASLSLPRPNTHFKVNNTTRITTNAQFVSFNRTESNKNGLAKSRLYSSTHAPISSLVGERPAPHAIPPYRSIVNTQMRTQPPPLRPKTVTVTVTPIITTMRRTTTVSTTITARPYDPKHRPLVGNVSLSLDYAGDNSEHDMESYIPEAEEDNAADILVLRRRISRAAQPIIAANDDYYDDLQRDRHINNSNNNKDILPDNNKNVKTAAQHVSQNCFQYLG